MEYQNDLIERKLRSVIQNQPNVAYIFLGSRRHLIQKMFMEKTRPLYRAGGHYPLGPISTDEHTYIAPDLFTAETALGTYQGMTDQIVMSRTPGAFRTVLAPRGSSKPEWLSLRK